jgi:hypothetical protein
MTTERYMSIEQPDIKAVVDFLGRFGVVVKLTLESNELSVQVTGTDDRCTILLDECLTVPESDTDE